MITLLPKIVFSQDVVAEIQRLKEEANRFIAILAAQDEEEEDLSPEKRQNLTREVESLQVIIIFLVFFPYCLQDEGFWDLRVNCVSVLSPWNKCFLVRCSLERYLNNSFLHVYVLHAVIIA